MNRPQWSQPGPIRNIHAGEGTVVSGASQSNRNGYPSGYRPPYTFSMPVKAGGLTSRGHIIGEGDVDYANLAGGLNAESDLSGSGDITSAALGLIVSLVADLSGSGALTADILGKLEAAADLVGDGDVTAALGAIADLLADLLGSGTCEASAVAKAYMSSDIVVTGDLLSTANVAEAVWGAVAEGGLTYAEVHRIVLAVLAGKTTISGSDVAFRDLADSKDRVAATMTGSERTSVTLDGT
jgi:hypothetical protein